MNRNFSSTTTPQIFQKSIESNVDKRMGNIFGPQLGKKMSMFVDDLNIPEINSWGDQPTNEFFRSVIEMKGFYSLGKKYVSLIKNLIVCKSNNIICMQKSLESFISLLTSSSWRL